MIHSIERPPLSLRLILAAGAVLIAATTAMGQSDPTPLLSPNGGVVYVLEVTTTPNSGDPAALLLRLTEEMEGQEEADQLSFDEGRGFVSARVHFRFETVSEFRAWYAEDGAALRARLQNDLDLDVRQRLAYWIPR